MGASPDCTARPPSPCRSAPAHRHMRPSRSTGRARTATTRMPRRPGTGSRRRARRCGRLAYEQALPLYELALRGADPASDALAVGVEAGEAQILAGDLPGGRDRLRVAARAALERTSPTWPAARCSRWAAARAASRSTSPTPSRRPCSGACWRRCRKPTRTCGRPCSRACRWSRPGRPTSRLGSRSPPRPWRSAGRRLPRPYGSRCWPPTATRSPGRTASRSATPRPRRCWGSRRPRATCASSCSRGACVWWPASSGATSPARTRTSPRTSARPACSTCRSTPGRCRCGAACAHCWTGTSRPRSPGSSGQRPCSCWRAAGMRTRWSSRCATRRCAPPATTRRRCRRSRSCCSPMPAIEGSSASWPAPSPRPAASTARGRCWTARWPPAWTPSTATRSSWSSCGRPAPPRSCWGTRPRCGRPRGARTVRRPLGCRRHRRGGVRRGRAAAGRARPPTRRPRSSAAVARGRARTPP